MLKCVTFFITKGTEKYGKITSDRFFFFANARYKNALFGLTFTS